ncbi:hypothetical protein LX36DRAFT_662784, partial [Colletotrichum falcatum]
MGYKSIRPTSQLPALALRRIRRLREPHQPRLLGHLRRVPVVTLASHPYGRRPSLTQGQSSPDLSFSLGMSVGAGLRFLGLTRV